MGEISFPENGTRWQMVLSRLNLEALISDIRPEHDNTVDSVIAERYNRLRALSPADLRVRFDTFLSVFQEGLVIEVDGKLVPVNLE